MAEVVIGIDPHEGSHTAVALDRDELNRRGMSGDWCVPASPGSDCWILVR